MSCSNPDLPFIGTRYCSEAQGVNYKIEISRNGNTRITLAGTGGSRVIFDDKFIKSDDQMQYEHDIIIKKDYALYPQGKIMDTLPYIKEANW